MGGAISIQILTTKLNPPMVDQRWLPRLRLLSVLYIKPWE